MQLESSATEDEDRRRLLKMKKRRGTFFLQQMKPTLTTSRVGGGRWGKMGTGCPLRRARRRTAATGDGDTFVEDETDADHFFFSEQRARPRQSGNTGGRRMAGEDGDGVPTAAGEEEDGGDRRQRHICSK